MPRRTEKSQQLTLPVQENQRKGVRFSNYVANMNAPVCTYFLIPNLERQSIENLFKEGREMTNVSAHNGAHIIIALDHGYQLINSSILAPTLQWRLRG